MTNYNYEAFVEECLQSIAAQTHQNLELIIVDDCSDRDASVDVIKAWAEGNHSRFISTSVIQHERNLGPSQARNSAFSRALGTSVFIVDADNILFPRAIEKLLRTLSAGNFDAVYPQLEIFGDRRGIGSADIWDHSSLVRNNYVDVMSLVKKSAWQIVGGFDHIDEGWEDYDFWLKFLDHDLTAGYVPEILCRYRVHGVSRTFTSAYANTAILERIMNYRHRCRDVDNANRLAGQRLSSNQDQNE